MSEYLSQMQVALDQLAAVNAANESGLEGTEDPALCPMLTYLHIQQIIDQVNTAEGEQLGHYSFLY